MTSIDKPRCEVFGAHDTHDTSTIENWDGERVPVCELSRCAICQQRGPIAVVNRAYTCGSCEPEVIDGLARMAAARKHAGLPLTQADLRALDVTA